MIDASSKPFAENIEITKRVVEYAHDHGVVVEAELGTLAGIEDEVKVAAHEASYTRPEEVEEFVSKTGCDSLAIAIGNAHGNYKATPKLRFDILAQVAEDTHTPLVLHGGTGISPEDFRRCAQTGIQKINIATATFDSVEQTVRGAYDAGAIGGYYDLQGAEVQGAYKNAHRHILIFGTDGKA